MADRIISTVGGLDNLTDGTIVSVSDNSGYLLKSRNYRGYSVMFLFDRAGDVFTFEEAIDTFGPFRILWAPEDYNG